MTTLNDIAELLRAQDRALRNIGNDVTQLRQDVPHLKSIVQVHDQRINEHEQRIMRAEWRLQSSGRVSSRPPVYRSPPSGEALAAEYGLKEGNTGTYRIPPTVLEDIAKKFKEQETSQHAIDDYLDKWKKRIVFALAIIVPVAGSIGWALTHFLHW